MALCRESYSSPSDGSGVYVDPYRCYPQETPRQPHSKRRRFHPLRGLRNIFKRKTKLPEAKADVSDHNPIPCREAARTPETPEEIKDPEPRSPSPPRTEILPEKHLVVLGDLSKESITKSSHSTCSEGSLLSSEIDEVHDKDDLSAIISSSQPLTHTAAKHKMAIRPKKNHAVSRARKEALPTTEENTSSAIPTSQSNPSISPLREVSYKSASLPAGVVPGEVWAAASSSQDGFFSRLLARKSGKKKKPVESRQRVQPLTISATNIPKSHSFRKQETLPPLDPLVTPSLPNFETTFVWVSRPGTSISETSINSRLEESTVWVTGGSYDPLVSGSGPESFFESSVHQDETLNMVSINEKCIEERSDSCIRGESETAIELKEKAEVEAPRPGVSIVSITLVDQGDGGPEEVSPKEEVPSLVKKTDEEKSCENGLKEGTENDNFEKDNIMDYIVDKPEVKEAPRFEIKSISSDRDFEFLERKKSLSELSSVFEKKSVETPVKFVGRQKSFSSNKTPTKKSEEEPTPKPTPVKRPTKEIIPRKSFGEEHSPVKATEEEPKKRIIESSRKSFAEEKSPIKTSEEEPKKRIIESPRKSFGEDKSPLKTSEEEPKKRIIESSRKSFGEEKIPVKVTEDEPKKKIIESSRKSFGEEKSPVNVTEEEPKKRIVESSRKLFDEHFTQRKAFEEIKGSSNEFFSPKKPPLVQKEKNLSPTHPKEIKLENIKPDLNVTEAKSQPDVEVTLRQRHSREIIRHSEEEPELLKVFARRSLKVKDIDEEDEVPVKSRDSDKENDDSVTIERKKIEYQRSVSTEDCLLTIHNVGRQRSKTLPDLTQPKTVHLKEVEPLHDDKSDEPKFKRIQQRKEEWEKRAQQAMKK